jgi:hypothetical protein
LEHHELGHTQLQNIHDRGDLVALCSVCHFAFDCGEWMFIPEEIRTWTERIKETPQVIQEYNSLRSIVFRRLLLIPDPESKAFQDNHYKSAFADRPTKIWPGEPGVVILRPMSQRPARLTAELREILHNFRDLEGLWLTYESPCCMEKCLICQRNKDEMLRKQDDLEDMNGKDNEENDKEEDDSEDDGEKVEDDGEENEDGGEKTKDMERDWMTSTPYDESIPYSHRYGYTWAGSTSNELMQLWQAYRKPAVD